MTAPASHGSGTRPLSRMVCSASRFSAAACCERVEIQPNRIAATSQPHSLSLRSSSRRGGWNRTVRRYDLAGGRDGGGGSAPLPFVLEGGEGDLPDVARRLHVAHVGLLMPAATGWEAVFDPMLPLSLHGGGCTTACHSFLSGVMTVDKKSCRSSCRYRRASCRPSRRRSSP